MAFIAVDSNGRVVAIARRQARLKTPTGGSVIDIGDSPAVVGWQYNATTMKVEPRTVAAVDPNQDFLDALPEIIRRKYRQLDAAAFERTSKNTLALSTIHLTRVVNACLIKANRDAAARFTILKNELMLHWGKRCANLSGSWSSGYSTTTFWRTGDTGAPVVVPGMVTSPATYANDGELYDAMFSDDRELF